MFELDKSVIDTIFNGLKESGLSMQQRKYVGLLETKIQEFNTHQEKRDSYLYDKLTPTEKKIVGLIRTGNTSAHAVLADRTHPGRGQLSQRSREHILRRSAIRS